ncbi:unnamed protein product [Musa acuminata subsp. malaccensis]|uniref:(wild Malaysian banana) hypothetical protein n=1 Tax=Musa acuminata subsp. malaccensis TaxID=214687 RepID=A0A804J2B6_MUSAM|nr:PREDICTED: allene oxide synthase 2-like [Musa acuminata subsp. malaccensis]CAG1837907.1 unnamed protein product [Musa acuminata subsp. malaccensis]
MATGMVEKKVDDDKAAPSIICSLPIKEIPGSRNHSLVSRIKTRLEFYYKQREEEFFRSRIAAHGSTVFRINMPPGPFMAANSRVVALLDAKSFRVLLDVSKVEKKNVLTGTFVPPVSLTGGHRMCAYLDPSEPDHARVKQLVFNLVAARKNFFIPVFRSNFAVLFEAMDAQVASASGKSDFNKLSDAAVFDYFGEACFGVRPSATALGATGPTKATKWLFPQIAPLMTLGLPTLLEELFLHTFPLPSCLFSSDYKALYRYFESAASSTLDDAEKLGLNRKEACHHILFVAIFNAFGGFKAALPGIFGLVAEAGPSLHSQLAEEIRSAVAAEGGEVTLAAVERMELTRSVVYEALRLDPPVKYQYGKAKADLIIESHDAAYQVKKGEMLLGYQPCATKDPKVFGPNAGEFVADRFVGNAGRKLLEYVVWSNGPETEEPTVGNKQCAGKYLVVLVGRLLLVEFFLRYDTFTADVGSVLLGKQVNVTSLSKPTVQS